MIQDFHQRYIAARRAVIARRYHRMNPRQLEAVLAAEGPLLLLAGAGSGKTTVLINRVDNLLTFGRGSDTEEVPEWAGEEELAFLEGFPEDPSPEDWGEAVRLCAVEPAVPWSVIAITFTTIGYEIIKLKHNAPEWLAFRKTGIGASEAAAVLGYSNTIVE